jgi:hypothetical protein
MEKCRVEKFLVKMEKNIVSIRMKVISSGQEERACIAAFQTTQILAKSSVNIIQRGRY